MSKGIPKNGINKGWFNKGHKVNLGRVVSFETRKKISISHIGKIAWIRGKHHSEETKRKISESHIGIMMGENHPRWKGDEVSYDSLHCWVRDNLGKPSECVYCGRFQGRLHWASISHKAKRDLNDYIPLCVRCHKNYDSGKENYLWQ